MIGSKGQVFQTLLDNLCNGLRGRENVNYVLKNQSTAMLLTLF